MNKTKKYQSQLNEALGESVVQVLECHTAHRARMLHTPTGKEFFGSIYSLLRGQFPIELTRRPLPADETDADLFHGEVDLTRVAGLVRNRSGCRAAMHVLGLEPWELISEAYITHRYWRKGLSSDNVRNADAAVLFMVNRRALKMLNDSRAAKRTAEVVEFEDQAHSAEEPSMSETFRLATWRDDPDVQAALKHAAGWTMAEVADELGVTGRAIEHRIARKISKISKRFSSGETL